MIHNPEPSHQCYLGYKFSQHVEGAIWQCDDQKCNKLWVSEYRVTEKLRGYIWVPMRWWHFGAKKEVKRLIAVEQAEKAIKEANK